jgi:dTDP-4-amino-4,6-dideoxygalactose transaminase
VVTDDPALATRLRRLRNGGQGDKYQHLEFGVNSRLDEVQAAILRTRLTMLPAWTSRRRELASAYRRALTGAPVCARDVTRDVYHLFPC